MKGLSESLLEDRVQRGRNLSNTVQMRRRR